MPLFFSNKVEQNNTSKPSAYGGVFDRPKAAVNPLTLGAALNNKTASKTPTITMPANYLKTGSTTTTATPKTPVAQTVTNQQPQYQQPQQSSTAYQSGAGAKNGYSGSMNLVGMTPSTYVYNGQTYMGSDTGNNQYLGQAQNNGINGGIQNGQVLGEPTTPQPNLYKELIEAGIGSLKDASQVAKESGLLRQAMQRQTRDVMGNPYYSGSVRIGQSANIAQQQGAQLEGLAAQQQALTQQGNAYLSGAQQAAPVQVPYGTQFISPVTGESPIGQGGNGGGSQNPQNQAQIYAQEVAQGKRSYADAIAGMGLYGNVGKQFLDQAIRTMNPNFNFAQAQSLGANQGTIAPNFEFASQALQSVEQALNALGSVQRTQYPTLNALANFASIQTGVGGQATRQYISSIQTLRNAYAALLASAKGGTPTDYSAQASAEIPDVPTPNDIKAIRHNLETLGAARVGIYGNPGGGSNQGTQTGGGGIWDF